MKANKSNKAKDIPKAQHKNSAPLDDDWSDQSEEDLEVEHTGILYKVLNVDPKATQQELRESYKVLARTLHPDKNPNDPKAHNNFQQLSEAYKILSCETKRRIYDRTGELSNEGVTDIQKFVDAYIYYREQYKEVTQQDVLDFKDKYIGSKEEQEDLLDFFEDNEGDVTLVLEAIPYSTNDDIRRFNEFFQQNLADFPKEFKTTFAITCKNIKPYKEELTQEQADHKISNLAHLIQNKSKARGNDMMAGLLAKYGGGDLMLEYDPLDDPNYDNKTKFKEKKTKASKVQDLKSKVTKKVAIVGAAKKNASKKG